MRHPISAPSGVSQLSFERLIEAAKAVTTRGNGVETLGLLADLSRETTDAMEAYRAAKAHFHRAADQPRGLAAPEAYVAMVIAWACCATIALCHYYHYMAQSDGMRPNSRDLPWHKVAHATEGLFSILDGVDIAVLLAERRAQELPEDRSAEARLAASMLREHGIAAYFADEEVAYAAATH